MKSTLPADLVKKIEEMQTYTKPEQMKQYLALVNTLPWDKLSDDRLDLVKAKAIMDQHHYGMKEIKDKILEYLSVMVLTRDKPPVGRLRAPILCLVGLVGTGKTTFGQSLAETLGRQFVRIPFGGLGSALDLRGQSRLHPDAEPGLIIKALKRAGTRNPVILLDEIDRVTDASRMDIMGVLVELLDPEQNAQFTDHYLDFPFNLSDVLFVATANNTRNIATAVLDRLELIQMPSYTDEEKITIAKDFILSKVLLQSGLSIDNLTIDDSVWPKIVRPLGFDAGLRTLERTIEAICHKLARSIVENKAKHFHLTDANITNYLPNY
ncbi:MAG: AAA family ATPase [Candidatus Beckwithbacteria bacterium]|nr:AAA family ATPase [Candidatus Beckwithbacteria bacterium]